MGLCEHRLSFVKLRLEKFYLCSAAPTIPCGIIDLLNRYVRGSNTVIKDLLVKRAKSPVQGSRKQDTASEFHLFIA